MGWLEDSVEEFRKLPPAGKLAVGGAAVGVAILAYAQYRSGQASAATSTNSTGTTDPGANNGTSALTGMGVPSLSSNPADWQSWFSNGLTIPQGGQTASDGAPGSSTTSSASGAAVSAPAASVATAAAHVVASVTAPAPPPAPKPATVAGSIQNPTAAQSVAHRGTVTPAPRVTFIPTTIRPLPTAGGRHI